MRIVIALGGNALGYSIDEQISNVKKTAKYIAEIIKEGNEVVITHGNGPQVGLINLAFSEGSKINEKVFNMPFPECNALSEGYIGYHLSNAIKNELTLLNIDKSVCPIITQVLVDKNDNAFNNPTKPIGSFYTKEEASKLPFFMKEDAGRGYRRYIASPLPKEIIELETIKNALNNKEVVIACGGGGVPVVRENNILKGVDAVIDKDLSSALLAKDINADILLILTAVDSAKINYKKENEKSLHFISKDEITSYLLNNEFSEGSMKPKVKAALNFVIDNNKKAIITDLENSLDALKGLKGTIITF